MLYSLAAQAVWPDQKCLFTLRSAGLGGTMLLWKPWWHHAAVGPRVLVVHPDPTFRVSRVTEPSPQSRCDAPRGSPPCRRRYALSLPSCTGLVDEKDTDDEMMPWGAWATPSVCAPRNAGKEGGGPGDGEPPREIPPRDRPRERPGLHDRNGPPKAGGGAHVGGTPRRPRPTGQRLACTSPPGYPGKCPQAGRGLGSRPKA
jgi:hypothetical protein